MAEYPISIHKMQAKTASGFKKINLLLAFLTRPIHQICLVQNIYNFMRLDPYHFELVLFLKQVYNYLVEFEIEKITQIVMFRNIMATILSS